jgi:hypothetical protein
MRSSTSPLVVLARTPAEPRAGQLELTEQGSERDGLPILDAIASTAARAGHARGQERRDLATEDLALHCQQKRLGFGQRQAQVLRPLVVLVEHDEIVDAHLLVIIGNDHELELEA